MERKARSKLNTQIYEEACEWLLEFRSGEPDAAARSAFDLWVRRSPEHLAAYLEVATIWNEGRSLDPEKKWDAKTLIAQSAEEHENVVPLVHAAAAPVAASRSSGADQSSAAASAIVDRAGFLSWRTAMAASVLVACLCAALLVWLNRDPAYSTGIGEQRSIALTDGSTVELNSRSKLRVRYSDRERAIDLLEGQALFNVAKDAARPFVVSSGSTRVRAVGTQFDVYRKRGGTVVTVVEGRVAVLSEGAATSAPADAPRDVAPVFDAADAQDSGSGAPARASTYLSAGEQLIVTPTTVQKAPHPNIATATAWTQRQLVFDSASLTEVAEEFNRYNERPLLIQDPSLYDFHISGVFSSTDPASLIRFLRERPGVQVIETPSEIRVEKKGS